MGAKLPEIACQVFERQIQKLSPWSLSRETLDALWIHYQELKRWNETVSLVGPAAAADVLSRHYGESLAGLPLLGARASKEPTQILDIGSGGGFPGFVLAACLSSRFVTLLEPRERKAAFLQAAARKASLPCRCLNARVSRVLPPGLPDQVDVITMRGLRLPADALSALAGQLAPSGRLLLWQSEPFAEPPGGFSVVRVVTIPESDRRCIVEYARDAEPAH